MKIVAFLQNSYFNDPVRAKAIYDSHAGDLAFLARLDQRYLFYRCETGKRLLKHLGEDLCSQIVWANASPEIGGVSHSKFPPDPSHIRAILEHFKPDLVICFGKVAQEGVAPLFSGPILSCPHPAARGVDVKTELDALSTRISVHEYQWHRAELYREAGFVMKKPAITQTKGVFHGT